MGVDDILKEGIGLGFLSALPMLAWMAFLAFVDTGPVWLLTGTALALVFSLAMLAACLVAHLQAISDRP